MHYNPEAFREHLRRNHNWRHFLATAAVRIAFDLSDVDEVDWKVEVDGGAGAIVFHLKHFDRTYKLESDLEALVSSEAVKKVFESVPEPKVKEERLDALYDAYARTVGFLVSLMVIKELLASIEAETEEKVEEEVEQ